MLCVRLVVVVVVVHNLTVLSCYCETKVWRKERTGSTQENTELRILSPRHECVVLGVRWRFQIWLPAMRGTA